MKVLWLCLILLFSAVYAQMDMPDPVDAEIVSEQMEVKSGQSFWVAVNLKIEDHWHTYWRNPGSSGLPTTIKWSLPTGVTASDIHWATPMWIESSGLVSLAYEHQVAHLVKITVDKSFAEKTLSLNAEVDWLVCTDVGELAGCYPGSAKVNISIPVAEAKINENNKAFFKKARAQLPKTNDDWQVLASRHNNKLKIFLVDKQQQLHEKMTFFPHQEIFKLEASQKLSNDKGVYVLETALGDNAPKDLKEISGIVKVGGENLEISVGVVNQDLSVSQVEDIMKNGGIDANDGGSDRSYLITVLLNALFAFLGGIILNAMPCVLPVISLKIFGFIEDAGGDKSKIWKSGIAFTLGVLLSFWFLVILLYAIRDFGLFGIEGAGWGYQLQSPTFVLVLVIGLVIFSLNLFGVFEIGTSLTSVGSQSSKKSGLLSSFLTGIFTTIIATPCSAPFMATAIGFALAQPTAVGFSIFTSLALGLAFPYLILSIFPSWLSVLPKPGRWMESFKKSLAFPMLAAAIWLFSILIELLADDVSQASTIAMSTLAAVLFFSLASWIYGRWGMASGKKRIVAFANVLIFLVCGIFYSHQVLNLEKDTSWVAFSPQKVQQLLAEDKPVFIDFTATWCITCQANKKVALRTDNVMKKFAEYGVITMTADWTKRDKIISDYLAQFGRNSVPLYLLYHGKSGEYTILPQLLTQDIVIDALQKNLTKKDK